MKRIFICLIFLSSSALVYGQNYLEINSIDSANSNIKNFIYVLKDSTKQLTLNQVSSDYRKDFILLKDFSEELSVKIDYWLHLKIKNNLNSKISIGLFIPKENNIGTLFSISDNEILKQKTGVFCKAIENDEIVPFTNILKLKDAKSSELFIKIQSINDELPNFSLKIINVNHKIRKNNQYVIFGGIVQGLLWIMILYGLFLFILNKEKLYLYYSLYIICNSIWYLWGLALGFRFFPGLPREIFPYSDAVLFLSYVFYLQFIRSFLKTSLAFVKWDRLLKILQVVLVIEIIRIPIFISLTNLVVANYIIQNIVGEIVVFFIILAIIKIIFLKTKLAYIIGIGSSFLILGATISSILFLIYLDDSVYFLQQIGTIIELVFFTFGISYRYWQIEKDKQEYQEKLIFQLQENASLNEKVNRELEHKVQERTREITEKNQELGLQKKHIEEIHKNVSDSITYAKRIQEALLLKDYRANSILGNHFVLFKPKDIVSGDFYWATKINNLLFFTVADCTGHGVPGALMSILGVSFLNEIVRKKEVIIASEVLSQLRSSVIDALQETTEVGTPKDGMDIALCILNLDTQEMQYAGANNPLYLLSNKTKKLNEIKANKMSVAISDNMQPFTNHIFQTQKGDIVYLATDGYQDQFGGPEDWKFLSKKFKELLLGISQKPMAEQKEILTKTIEGWINCNGKKYDQTDDITIMAIMI